MVRKGKGAPDSVSGALSNHAERRHRKKMAGPIERMATILWDMFWGMMKHQFLRG